MDGVEAADTRASEEDLTVADQRGGATPDLTVLILSYNVRPYLALALRTAEAACRPIDAEILVVDNASSDGSAEMVEQEFIGRREGDVPVRLIRSPRNLGFAAGNNLGLAAARGRHVLLLNPDVVVHPHALEALVRYLDAHPDVGAAGGRIINPDGTSDPGARRGFPSPLATFCHMVGLSYVFPRSSRFGRYNLSYLDDGHEQEVGAISGCFMCVRREVVDQVGALDEAFFMYGEDLDWSYRIRSAGWKIAYVPQAEIVHFKGESTRSLSRWRQLYEFHRAMHIFVRKHIAGKHRWPVVALIELGIALRGIGASVWRLTRIASVPLADLLLLALCLVAALSIRTLHHWGIPPFSVRQWVLVGAVFAASGGAGAWLVGLYRGRRHEPLRALVATAIGAALCIVAIFFIRTINFSRIVTGLTWLFTGALAAGWRSLLSPRTAPLAGHGLVLGCGPRAASFLRMYAAGAGDYEIVGLIRGREDDAACTSLEGRPVIGELDDLPILLRRLRVDDLIVAWEHYRYSDLLALTRRGGRYPRRVRLVPDGLQQPDRAATPDDWPLIDLDIHRRRWQ